MAAVPAGMISDRAAKYLWDARRAAERIARFTSGRGYDDYRVDEMLRSAAERQFEIVGEAFAGLRRPIPIWPPPSPICRASWLSATC